MVRTKEFKEFKTKENNKPKEKTKELTEPEDEIDEKQFQEKSELAEVMDGLDQDIQDKITKMSSIDFNTRLNSTERASMVVIDELTRMGLFPENTGITRQFKRLAVSLEGKGRTEKVQMVCGERENRTGVGAMEKVAGMFQKRG